MMRKTSAMACGITLVLLLLLCVVPSTAAASRVRSLSRPLRLRQGR